MRVLLGLILIVGLGVGAFVLFLGGTSAANVVRSEEGRASSPSTEQGVAAELAALREEVAALRRQQTETAMRLTQLESRPAPAAAPPERVALGAEESPELAEVRELVAAIQDPTKAKAPELENFVLDVLDEREERDRAERQQRRLDAIVERVGERVGELSAELGLSPYQEQEMVGLLSSEATRRESFFQEMRDSGTWDRRAMREGLQTLHDETRGALQAVLTPDQLARYEELEGERGGPWGRGGGGPGAGGPGGAGGGDGGAGGGDRRGGGGRRGGF